MSSSRVGKKPPDTADPGDPEARQKVMNEGAPPVAPPTAAGMADAAAVNRAGARQQSSKFAERLTASQGSVQAADPVPFIRKYNENKLPYLTTFVAASRLAESATVTKELKSQFFGPESVNKLLDSDQVFIDPKSKEKVVRFCVTVDKEMVLGHEGIPSNAKGIPAHCQLTSKEVCNEKFNAQPKSLDELDKIEARHASYQCLTAGNMYFNKDNELTGIDHKSGDFRPPFESLQVALKVIDESNMKVADKVKVDQLNVAGRLEKTLNCAKKELFDTVRLNDAKSTASNSSSPVVSTAPEMKR